MMSARFTTRMCAVAIDSWKAMHMPLGTSGRRLVIGDGFPYDGPFFRPLMRIRRVMRSTTDLSRQADSRTTVLIKTLILRIKTCRHKATLGMPARRMTVDIFSIKPSPP
ncbi:MAG: hypothetical protein ABI533_04520 [Betaproteobacteria bacterium]